MLRHLRTLDVEGEQGLLKRREEEERGLEAPSNVEFAMVLKLIREPEMGEVGGEKDLFIGGMRDERQKIRGILY